MKRLPEIHLPVKVIPPLIKNGMELYPLTSKNFLPEMFCTSAKNFTYFLNLYSA